MKEASGPITPGRKRPRRIVVWIVVTIFLIVVLLRSQVRFYTIPTAAMEGTVLVGDMVLATDWSYGQRIGTARLPGSGTPQRNDLVAFNFPEGDTVFPGFENQSYYQLVRQYGREKLLSPGFRIRSYTDEGPRNVPIGEPEVRKIADREVYLKRCVAIAGDTVSVIHGQLHVNGEVVPLPVHGRFSYEFVLKKGERFNGKRLNEKFGISESDLQYEGSYAIIPTTPTIAEQLADFSNVESMTWQDHPEGFYDPYGVWPIFPNRPNNHWSEDNFGPLWVPRKDATIELDTAILPLYERVIRVYEQNYLSVSGGVIRINGQATNRYTFKQDYYWMMGDNRHRSQDSRFWGFVPFDHVIAKVTQVWLSDDPHTGQRWGRWFTDLE